MNKNVFAGMAIYALILSFLLWQDILHVTAYQQFIIGLWLLAAAAFIAVVEGRK